MIINFKNNKNNKINYKDKTNKLKNSKIIYKYKIKNN